MTDEQWALIDALADCTFGIGTASKRFVRDTYARGKDAQLSERAEAFAWRIAYHYRRQLPKALADEAVRRKKDHQWMPGDVSDPDAGERRWQCRVCGNTLYSQRDWNAPCPGPPSPKPERKPRKVKAAAPEAPVDERQMELPNV